MDQTLGESAEATSGVKGISSIPQWIGRRPNEGTYLNADAMRTTDTGRRFWGAVTTGPLTMLALANIIVAWQYQGAAQPWWLASSVLTLVERLATFSYFIPTAIRLMHAPEPPTDKDKSIALGWAYLNRWRLVLSLCGWLGALMAFSLKP
jgi:hypothetical protein